MLSLSNLSVDSRLSLDSLELVKGEIMVVLGPNGAGKSSLITALAGLIPQARSAIELNGEPLSGLSVESRAAMISVLTQRHSLDFAFSVEEVVMMGAYPLSLTPSEKRMRMEQLIVGLDLGSLLEKPYTEISVGEAQRVQIARVLMQRSVQGGVIMMDEPLAALDMKHKQQVMDFLMTIKEEGQALLLILHDLNLAADFGDKFLLLKEGVCVAKGGRNAVLTETVLSDLFDISVKEIRSEGSSSYFKVGGRVER